MSTFMKILKSNLRESGMYIALIAIMLFFQVQTSGAFLSPYNFNNLFMQTGYVAVLAIGMTLVIIIRHIDLSVGYTAGFLGAVAAILLSKYSSLNPYLVIFIVLVFGLLIGLTMGTLVAKVGIPSFVASLAGMLFFRGALLKVTNSETILINNDVFSAIGKGHLPTLGLSIQVFTIGIALIGIIIFTYTQITSRNKKKTYGFDVLPVPFFVAKIVLISLAILYVVNILAGFKGIPITVAIVLFVLAIYHFISNHTTIGRHVYAVGGNPEAAKLSGISVNKITLLVFGSMGMLSALSGILYSTRLASATPSAGQMFELEAIAAAYIGGVSAAGGVGKVTGSIIGALVMASLSNGMNLMGVGVSYQYIIRAGVLIAAVIFDIKTRNMKLN